MFPAPITGGGCVGGPCGGYGKRSIQDCTLALSASGAACSASCALARACAISPIWAYKLGDRQVHLPGVNAAVALGQHFLVNVDGVLWLAQANVGGGHAHAQIAGWCTARLGDDDALLIGIDGFLIQGFCATVSVMARACVEYKSPCSR